MDGIGVSWSSVIGLSRFLRLFADGWLVGWGGMGIGVVIVFMLYVFIRIGVAIFIEGNVLL